MVILSSTWPGSVLTHSTDTLNEPGHVHKHMVLEDWNTSVTACNEVLHINTVCQKELAAEMVKLVLDEVRI